MNIEPLLRRIRLGEDSTLELKQVRVGDQGKRIDAEGSFNSWTNADGFASLVFTKPSQWEITVAPYAKTVKSEVLKVKFEKFDTEKSLRLPVTNVQGANEASGGM